jgi:hypothetical protein
MALIKCPGCSHTVSSVASKCPKCGTLLSQFRFVQGEGGALTECRRCSRKVLSGATICPYCGVSRPGRRSPYFVVALLGAFAVPVLVLAALRGRAPTPPLIAPAVFEQPQAPRAVTVQAPPQVTEGTVPADTTPLPVAAPSPAGESATIETRWIVDWANVREGRALGTRVIRVLRPGSSVQVTDRQAGWWALYADGRVVGYVAGSLLSEQAPLDRPPGERVP